MVGKVVTKTGAMVQEWVSLYKVAVQLVLLYRSESWLVTGAMLKNMRDSIICHGKQQAESGGGPQ